MPGQTHWGKTLTVLFWLFPLSFIVGFGQLYQPQQLGQWLFCLSLLIPWFFCAPFIHSRQRQGLLWFSLLALIYLFTSLVGTQSPWPQRLWPLMDAVVLTACFIITMLYLRKTRPHTTKQANPKNKETPHHATS
jgi:uncharacterized membrane protein